MKNINCKTNRPLSFALLGNALLLIFTRTAIKETEIGQFFAGALLSFTAVAWLKVLWNAKHETSFSEWKKSLLAGLKNKN